MASFKIKGGKKLSGEITPQGAKNEVLQILSAVLLSAEKITINNIPDIVDVNKLIEILGDLGVKIKKLDKGSYSFKADEINLNHLQSEDFIRLKIGIATNLDMRPSERYVLKPFPSKYNNDISLAVKKACEALEFFLENTINDTMNQFNRRIKGEK